MVAQCIRTAGSRTQIGLCKRDLRMEDRGDERHSSNTFVILLTLSLTVLYYASQLLPYTHIHSTPAYDHTCKTACYPNPASIVVGIVSRH